MAVLRRALVLLALFAATTDPSPAEVRECNGYLAAELATVPAGGAILALGRIAHDATLQASGRKLNEFRFAHGARHDLGRGVVLFDSYHCSRYNTNTRRLTPEMFRRVFDEIAKHLADTGGGNAGVDRSRLSPVESS